MYYVLLWLKISEKMERNEDSSPVDIFFLITVVPCTSANGRGSTDASTYLWTNIPDFVEPAYDDHRYDIYLSLLYYTYTIFTLPFKALKCLNTNVAEANLHWFPLPQALGWRAV